MRRSVLFVLLLLAAPAVGEDAPTTQPASLFRDPVDGAFDISAFLTTREGFLPIAIPITEPAVGYGLGFGLAFLHDKPVSRPGPPGEPDRIVMPNMTMAFGAATENGTWAGGLAHLRTWNQGRIRYLGGVGYGEVHLDYFGRNDAFNGHGIAYTNKAGFLLQRVLFQVGRSDFFIGPQYRFMSTDSNFDTDLPVNAISNADFQSRTSGLGMVIGYDSRDQPFNPRHGIRADVTLTQNAEWLGGDFDYLSVAGYFVANQSLTDRLVLGIRLDTAYASGEVPFYDLPYINMRGVPVGRYTDQVSALIELELRYDLTERWSVVGFGGVGRVADSYGDLGTADNRESIGTGFRYMIARDYGISMGLDFAYSEDGFAFYIGMGTGWPRP